MTKKYGLVLGDLIIPQELERTLAPLSDATQHFSASWVPLLSDVLMTFDHLFLTYQDMRKNTSPVIKAMINRMLEVIKKYYSLTDDSKMYQLAVCESFLILHDDG